MRKHRRILDMLSLSFALALMIIQWGGPLTTLAFRACVIWLIPSQLYDLWQKFNVPRGVLFACAVALIIIVFGFAPLPYPPPDNSCSGARCSVPATTIFKMKQA